MWGGITRESIEQLKRQGSTEFKYKRFGILATPEQLPDTLEWKLEVRITRDIGHALLVKPFRAPYTFKTREEAAYRGIAYGQDIIDGKVPGCSVVELQSVG